jgi:ADP-heptose:LPS heptosyltransferase
MSVHVTAGGGEVRRVVEDVHRIAVLRANALGDLLLTLPAFEALHATYPNAELVLLGREQHRELLEGRPGPLDRIIAIPHGAMGDETAPGQCSPEEREAFWRSVADDRWDIAVQLHGGGRNSNGVLLRLGARVTVGARTPDAPPLDRWLPYREWQHESVRQLELTALVGAGTGPLDPRLEVTERDREAAAAVVSNDGPLLVLHPGATDPRRRWPMERFAELGDVFAAHGASVVVTGHGTEADLAAEVVARMRCEAVDVAGRLSLPGLVGLLSRARLVVSNDTGPLHLARVLGTPSVGIFWFGNLVTAGPLTRAHQLPLISWRTACPECGADNSVARCQHDPSFVGDVSLDAVLSTGLDLWALARDDAGRVVATATGGDVP